MLINVNAFENSNNNIMKKSINTDICNNLNYEYEMNENRN